MPEYLAPGVYVEETSFRAKSIEGVSTSTAGFVGPSRYGPIEGLPQLITSFQEFERIFGGDDRLNYFEETERSHNYLAHGVRAFFENGGRRVYVSRIYALPDPQSPSAVALDALLASRGHASGTLGGITIQARFPGEAGECRVGLRLRVGQDVLSETTDADGTRPVLRGVRPDDIVALVEGGSPGDSHLARAVRDPDGVTWRLDDGAAPVTVDSLSADEDTVHVLTVSVEVTFLDRLGEVIRQETWEDLRFEPDPDDSRALTTRFAAQLPSRTDELRTPVSVLAPSMSGVEIASALLAQLADVTSPPAPGSPPFPDDIQGLDRAIVELALSGGSDGTPPQPEHYQGDEPNDDPERATGLMALENIPDISIVAAPGYSAGGRTGTGRVATQAISNALISHAERMTYRIAVLDSADGQLPADVRAQRGQLDSTHAALYYPWIRVLDPVTDQEIVLPPSGFVSGIYARNDIENGVHKAPANEVVRGALGFERTLNKAHQDVLNPEGINCFRFFEGRGNRLWGARTISSDPEWKYVNLRRYFAYLEHSIDKGTQWAVFEPNGEQLWANLRRTVEDFLLNEWSNGALLGEKADKAYFVKCDRSTMSQNDLDNGRLVCLIGVAPLRPAEFVIFRIGQWTADRKV